MRVLLQVRRDVLEYAGGQGTVVRETAHVLRSRGIDVRTVGGVETNLERCDVVQVYGMMHPAEPLIQARLAVRA